MVSHVKFLVQVQHQLRCVPTPAQTALHRAQVHHGSPGGGGGGGGGRGGGGGGGGQAAEAGEQQLPLHRGHSLCGPQAHTHTFSTRRDATDTGIRYLALE